MKRNVFLTTLSALTLGAVVAASVLPAAARGMDGAGKIGARMSFEQLDADSDGKLTLEEFQAPMKERMARIDTNGDGALSEEELQAARDARMGPGRDGQRMGKMHGKMGGHGKMYGQRGDFEGHRGLMTDEQRLERAQAMIEMKDANGDGVLSVEELAAKPDGSRIFARIDADKDGAITKQEFDAARADFAGKRGKMFRQQN